MILTLIVGVGFFIYPDVASWWNGRIQAGVINTYQVDVEQLQADQRNTEIQRAREFNESITEINISDPFADTEALPEEYMSTLNVSGTMATIEIPAVNISLPIMHGTSDAVLDRAAGHLTGTSFPIGGEGTHAVITAHSGLSNSRKFTDLLDGRITYGDYFFINVMGLRLAYQVDQILTVTPDRVDSIVLYPGEDFVTLITCTPLAVNSYRLLVRGTRVPYVQDMAETIVPVITILETNWRLITAIIAFGGFIIIFTLYQVIRIIRTRWRKKLVKVPVAPPAPDFDYDDDPYIVIPPLARQPLTRLVQPPPPPVIQASPTLQPVRNQSSAAPQSMYVYERATPLPERSAPLKRRKSSGRAKRLVLAGLAIVILLAGAGITFYPTVRRAMYDRYAENLINEWVDSLDDARSFIQRRWLEEGAALVDAITTLPVAYVNGDRLETHTDYYTGDVTVSLGNLSFGYVSQLAVDSGGYLTLGGQPLGNPTANNGHLVIGDLFVAHSGVAMVNGDALRPYQPYQGSDQGVSGLYVAYDGNLYIDIGGGIYINTNGGNISLSVITLGPSGELYIGDTPLADLTTEEFDFYDFDLDFIFNFDLNQDPMYWLNGQMDNYNDDLHEADQEDLNSLESMEEVDFSVTETAGIPDEMLGFITIEAINIRIPIFAGSSHGNMLRGAAHMTQTSLPVGGMNTNSVITAHRGLSIARMFRDLDRLKGTNEIILITNPYQTLRYQVTGYQVIPDRVDVYEQNAIMIQEGRDMITLLTCHPYRINDQRLLIFADRIPD